MGLLQSKGKAEKLVEGVDFSHLLKEAARATLQSALDQPVSKAREQRPLEVATGSAGIGAGKVTKPLRGATKPALVAAGGAAGITAASAAISALRRKQKT